MTLHELYGVQGSRTAIYTALSPVYILEKEAVHIISNNLGLEVRIKKQFPSQGNTLQLEVELATAPSAKTWQTTPAIALLPKG